MKEYIEKFNVIRKIVKENVEYKLEKMVILVNKIFKEFNI